ncbi:hypothetical protein BDW68DRAFT_73846 [Aspergillus falconensis]
MQLDEHGYGQGAEREHCILTQKVVNSSCLKPNSLARLWYSPALGSGLPRHLTRSGSIRAPGVPKSQLSSSADAMRSACQLTGVRPTAPSEGQHIPLTNRRKYLIRKLHPYKEKRGLGKPSALSAGP